MTRTRLICHRERGLQKRFEGRVRAAARILELEMYEELQQH